MSANVVADKANWKTNVSKEAADKGFFESKAKISIKRNWMSISYRPQQIIRRFIRPSQRTHSRWSQFTRALLQGCWRRADFYRSELMVPTCLTRTKIVISIMWASWGAMILGHKHPRVLQAIEDAVQCGTSYGAPCRAEVEMAELNLPDGAFGRNGAHGQFRYRSLYVGCASGSCLHQTQSDRKI